jgi:ATP-dependent DNA helicase DinG
MIAASDYDKFFPFNNIRNEQRTAIEFALQSYAKGKRFVVIEAATGVGKSAIALTIARAVNSADFLHLGFDLTRDKAYIITTQKILQEQYDNDFGAKSLNLVKNIKSASNYACSFYKEQSCGESRRVLKSLGEKVANTDFYKCCKGGQCTYLNDKDKFLNADVGITNFSYFLAETKYTGALKPRKLLIIDEAHNVNSELSKFVEITYSEKFAKEVLQLNDVPQVQDGDEDADKIVVDWIKSSYKPKLVKEIAKLEKAIEKQLKIKANVEDDPLLNEFSKQNELLDKHICKLNRFLEDYQADNWIMNVIEPKDPKHPYKRFEFKPINSAKYAEKLLYEYGDIVLFLSATIINKDAFCKSVGLKSEEVAFISIPSPFPVENRLVNYLPAGKMSMQYQEQTLPKMVDTVKALLELHKNEKGIIHSVSFKVAKYLIENIKDSRLLIHDSTNRDLILKQHKMCSEPTVIISPSMSEGVDLADDISRFQIICKVPFPYLGDKVIKKRMLQDKEWYPYQTAKTIIQSLGRSIRNKNDFAVSYILDEDWQRFYNSNKHMFSKDFCSTLRM